MLLSNVVIQWVCLRQGGAHPTEDEKDRVKMRTYTLYGTGETVATEERQSSAFLLTPLKIALSMKRIGEYQR
jgi:hypothetical protein